MHAQPRLLHLAAAIEAIEAGDYAGAAARCRALVGTARPDQVEDADAALLMGMALAGLAAAGAAPVAEALGWLLRVDALRPGGIAVREAGRMLSRMGQGPAAAPLYDAAMAATPERHDLAFACVSDLHDFGVAVAALDLLERHCLPPDRAATAWLVLRGVLLADLDRLAEARAVLEHAAENAPHEAAVWTNLGMLRERCGDFQGALAASDEAVRRAPDHPQVRLNRAVLLLRAGRFEAAWDDYEWRLRQPGGTRLPVETLLPTLGQASDALAGRTVLVWHEEGFGDTLHFIRYVPMLAALGARVIAWVPPELGRLLAAVPGLVGIVTDGAALPPFDWHCPVFSLPRVFATTLATIPSSTPYLRADPALVAAWRDRLPAATGRLRIGLAWAGQARPWVPGFALVDARRSMTLTDLAPLAAVEGVRFISLQKGPAATQARPPGLDLFDPMGAVTDFADTAAIVAQLDGVISVDTAIVHLAGGLGRPVIMLDRTDPCWRWLADRSDSPWYPTLRICRQNAPGDWASALHQAVGVLSGLRSQDGRV